MPGGDSGTQEHAETTAATARRRGRERLVVLAMQGNLALVVLLLASAGSAGDASPAACRRNLGSSPPGLLKEGRPGRNTVGVLALRGGVEVEEVGGGEVPYTEERDDGFFGELFHSVFPKLQAARNDEERENVFMHAIWEQVFENRSQPEHYLDAAHKHAMGFPLESAHWACLRCGSLSPPYSPQCVNLGCAMRRSDVEFAMPPEEFAVSVPDDCESFERALAWVQRGLQRTGFNQQFRTAKIRIGRGLQRWAQELEVLPNMTLHISSAVGGRTLGRLCLREGSSGSIRGTDMRWVSRDRSPHPIGVPMIQFEEPFNEDASRAFFRGEHPDYDFDPELDLLWAVLDFWGGPWEVEQCAILAKDAHPVATALKANVTLFSCDIGGMSFRGERSSSGVHALGKSRVALRECAIANGTSGGSGIFAGDYANVTLERCRLKYFDFGLSVAQSASIQAVGCQLFECVWGSFHVGFHSPGSSMRLIDNTVFGPGWYDERRPGSLEWSGNTVDDSELKMRGWQELSKARSAKGHRDCALDSLLSQHGGNRRR